MSYLNTPGYEAIFYSMVDLGGATLFKKTHSPYAGKHHLSIHHQLRMGSHDSLPKYFRILTGLILGRFLQAIPDNVSSWVWDSCSAQKILIYTNSPWLLALIVLTFHPSSTMLPEPWSRGFTRDVCLWLRAPWSLILYTLSIYKCLC